MAGRFHDHRCEEPRRAVALIEPLRALLREMDPDVPMYAVRSMPQIRDIAVAQPRLYLVLIGSFALTATLLAAIGLTACSPTRSANARARSVSASRSAPNAARCCAW